MTGKWIKKYSIWIYSRMNLQPIKQRFGILGNSPALDHALATATQVAPTDLTVLIMGESGVGKESFSKVIHALSSRKHNSFIAVNCGAIPEGTINSELFGHTKGAFTGATGERKGYFETANGGTIFLDEIGEMPLQTQQFLLRVLENKEFIKVGSSQTETTDVRVVAATNVDLFERVQQGKFREDLYYRLNTVPIRVPALRERAEDIYLLFRKFAHDFGERYHTSPVRLDDKSQLLLNNYAWKGNIRELKNVAEKISVLADDKIVTAEQLIRIMPELLQNRTNLPVVSSRREEFAVGTPNNASQSGYYEREILFKFLYEMKKDLNDVKALIAEIARTNNLRMPAALPTLSDNLPAIYKPNLPHNHLHNNLHDDAHNHAHDSHLHENIAHHEATETEHLPKIPTPIIIGGGNNISSKNTSDYNDAEEVQEPLSIADMEKEMIQRSLKKYRNRRKEAAKELGISERTLYRKINEYKLDE